MPGLMSRFSWTTRRQQRDAPVERRTLPDIDDGPDRTTIASDLTVPGAVDI
jgi:hypothetical protein